MCSPALALRLRSDGWALRTWLPACRPISEVLTGLFVGCVVASICLLAVTTCLPSWGPSDLVLSSGQAQPCPPLGCLVGKQLGCLLMAGVRGEGTAQRTAWLQVDPQAGSSSLATESWKSHLISAARPLSTHPWDRPECLPTPDPVLPGPGDHQLGPDSQHGHAPALIGLKLPPPPAGWLLRVLQPGSEVLGLCTCVNNAGLLTTILRLYFHVCKMGLRVVVWREVLGSKGT